MRLYQQRLARKLLRTVVLLRPAVLLARPEPQQVHSVLLQLRALKVKGNLLFNIFFEKKVISKQQLSMYVISTYSKGIWVQMFYLLLVPIHKEFEYKCSTYLINRVVLRLDFSVKNFLLYCHFKNKISYVSKIFQNLRCQLVMWNNFQKIRTRLIFAWKII